jgi:hypothetical protein
MIHARFVKQEVTFQGNKPIGVHVPGPVCLFRLRQRYATTTTASKETTVAETTSQTTAAAEDPNALPFVKDGSVTLSIATFDNYYSPASLSI